MKEGIHPTYYPNAKVYIGGELITTVGSTKPELHLDVWSGTHPFYTGQQRIIDTEGQVDRFEKRLKQRASNTVDREEKARLRRAKRQIVDLVDEDTVPLSEEVVE